MWVVLIPMKMQFTNSVMSLAVQSAGFPMPRVTLHRYVPVLQVILPAHEAVRRCGTTVRYCQASVDDRQQVSSD